MRLHLPRARWLWPLLVVAIVAAGFLGWFILRGTASEAVAAKYAPLVRTLQFSARVATLSRDGTLELPGIAQPARETNDALPLREESRALVDVEREHIRRVLASTGGRIEGASGAATILGLRPSTLRSLMRRLGIERAKRPVLGHTD